MNPENILKSKVLLLFISGIEVTSSSIGAPFTNEDPRNATPKDINDFIKYLFIILI
jgi:hypothetical protein